MTKRQASVIVHFNRPDACIAAVASLRKADPEIDILVLDNDSPAVAWGRLRESLDPSLGVELVRLPRNLGYAGAIEAADRVAPGLADRDLIFFGAHDAVIAPQTLVELEAALKASGASLAFATKTPPEIGHWTPVMGTSFSSIQDSMGSPVRWLDGLYFPAALFAVTGGAYRAGVRPHPDLFCYCEECDLGLRARRLGLRTILALDAPVLGADSAPAADSRFVQFLIARNLVLLAGWHGGRLTAVLCALRLLASALRSRLRSGSAERQSGLSRWNGALAGLRGGPLALDRMGNQYNDWGPDRGGRLA